MFRYGCRSQYRKCVLTLDSSGQQSRRITDESQLGSDVDQGGEHGIEHAEGCQADTDAVHQQGAHEVKADDTPTPTGDANGLGQFHQIIPSSRIDASSRF